MARAQRVGVRDMSSAYLRAAGVEIDIVGTIGDGGISAASVSRALRQDPQAPVLINVNSAGGNPNQALAIYDLLKSRSSPVRVAITAIAASAATIICAAGDEGQVSIAENAFFMIHQPSVSMLTGEADDLRHMADLLEKITDQMATIYARRTHRPKAKILAEMAAESWFTAAEAKERGFVDTITAPKKIAAGGDMRCFKNVPRILRGQGDTMERRYDELTLSERHRLANDDPEAFARLRAEYIGRPYEPPKNRTLSALSLEEKHLLANRAPEIYARMKDDPEFVVT
jgi:ATP-dependent protease ClpP protease subunit